MSTFTKLAAAAAAVAIVVVGGVLVLGGGIGPGASLAPTTSPAAPVASVTNPATTESATAAPGLTPAIEEFSACVPANEDFVTGARSTADVPGTNGDAQVEETRGYTWRGSINATDPRFTGTHFYSWDHNAYSATVGGQASSETFAEGHRIETVDGAWTGSAVGVQFSDGTAVVGPIALTGEGGYAGLTALMVTVAGDCFIDFRGSLMAIPEVPVPATGG